MSHLEDLDQAYEDGKISLEAYRVATKAVQDEMDGLSTKIADTAIPKVRDLSGVVKQAAGDMKTHYFNATAAIIKFPILCNKSVLISHLFVKLCFRDGC